MIELYVCVSNRKNTRVKTDYSMLTWIPTLVTKQKKLDIENKLWLINLDSWQIVKRYIHFSIQIVHFNDEGSQFIVDHLSTSVKGFSDNFFHT